MAHGRAKLIGHVTNASDKTIQKQNQKPTFHRNRGLVEHFSPRRALVFFGMFLAIFMLSGKLDAKEAEAQNNQKQKTEEVRIDPGYDTCWKPDFVKGGPGFGFAGNVIGLSDEILAQLGIKSFSGTEQIVSVRSPVGWIHYVMNEGWKGVLVILQPRNKNDKLFCGPIVSDDGSRISMNYAMDDKGNFAMLTDRGLIIFAPSFNGSGYIELAPVLGNLTNAKLSVKTIETTTGKKTTVEIIPQSGERYALVDLQTGTVETLLASNR